MIPYLLCLFPVAFVCLFSRKRYEGDKKAIALMLLPLFVLIAFRGVRVGADTVGYQNMFMAMNSNTFVYELSYGRIEVGFKVLLKILTYISDDPQILFIVQALVFYLCYIFFLSKNTLAPARFIILFLGLNLFNFYLTGVRQAFAMAICLVAYQMAKERKLIGFILCILLAFSFHKSALFFVAVYPLAGSKINKNYIILDVALISFIVAINEKMFSIGGEFFDIKYGIESAQNGYIMIVIVAVTTLLSFLYYDTLTKNNPDCAALIQINALSMAMWALRLYSRTAERVALFFLPFTILLLVELFDLPEDIRYRRLINLGTVLFFGAYFVYRLNGLGLVPYTFFWMTGGM